MTGAGVRAPFSVLMSVYARTRGDELRRCLDSLVAQQVPAAETVVVLDGPVSDDVLRQLEHYAEALHLVQVPLERNQGLGIALAHGLAACRHELVARMDTDDVCRPQRFARQLDFLARHPDIDVVGGAQVEAGDDGHFDRRMPAEPEALAKMARLRNPLNHPTVMFRRQAVLDAGGYQPFALFEDYYLWARLLHRGGRIANLPEVLVESNADLRFFGRRGGLRYLGTEIRLAREFRRMGFHGWLDSVRFLLLRAPVRLLPSSLRSLAYRLGARRPGRPPNPTSSA